MKQDSKFAKLKKQQIKEGKAKKEAEKALLGEPETKSPDKFGTPKKVFSYAVQVGMNSPSPSRNNVGSSKNNSGNTKTPSPGEKKKESKEEIFDDLTPREERNAEGLVNNQFSQNILKTPGKNIAQIIQMVIPSPSKSNSEKTSSSSSLETKKESKEEVVDDLTHREELNADSLANNQFSQKKPKIAVKDLNLEAVTMEPYKPSAKKPLPKSFNFVDKNASETPQKKQKTNATASGKNHCSEKRKKDIGDWGEELVFKKFKAEFPEVKTTWHNEKGEQGLPYDISQTPAEGIKKYCEVKTTVSSPNSTDNIASFSARQVAKMKEQRANYMVARVYNAEKAKPKIVTIEDPYQKLFHPDREEKVDGKVIKKSFTPAFPIKSFELKL